MADGRVPVSCVSLEQALQTCPAVIPVGTGHRRKAAGLLGMTERTRYRKIREYDILL